MFSSREFLLRAIKATEVVSKENFAGKSVITRDSEKCNLRFMKTFPADREFDSLRSEIISSHTLLIHACLNMADYKLPSFH